MMRLIGAFAQDKIGGRIAADRPVTEAARLIREELARTFPGSKFCVTVDKYSMGESVNVSWVEGPSSTAVDAVLNRYQDIDYDPLTNEILSGGNRYVQGQRRYTPQLRARETEAYRRGEYPGFLTEWHKLSSTDYFPQPPFKCVRGHATMTGGLD